MPEGGRIVATASLAGLTAMPDDPVYSATKHAVVGFVRSAAPALAARGISINAVCPGIADTTMLGGHARAAIDDASFPLLTPMEVADAVWLALTSGSDRPRLGRPAGQRAHRLPLRERSRRTQRRRRPSSHRHRSLRIARCASPSSSGTTIRSPESRSRRRRSGSGSLGLDVGGLWIRCGHADGVGRRHRLRPHQRRQRHHADAGPLSGRDRLDRRDARHSLRRPRSCSASGLGPAGRRRLARPGVGQAADAHPRVRRDRAHDLAREVPLEITASTTTFPTGPGATGLGKPLKIIVHPRRAEVPIYLARSARRTSR